MHANNCLNASCYTHRLEWDWICALTLLGTLYDTPRHHSPAAQTDLSWWISHLSLSGMHMHQVSVDVSF